MLEVPLLRTKTTPLFVMAMATLGYGCSSSSAPSERDIEKNLKSSLENCEYIKVMQVRKINGIENGDKSYTVKAEFLVEITPIEENSNQLNQYIEKLSIYDQLEGELRAVASEYNEAQSKLEDEYRKKIDGAVDWEGKKEVSKWRDEESRKLQTIAAAQNNIVSEKRKQLGLGSFSARGEFELMTMNRVFETTCPITTKMQREVVFGVLKSSNSSKNKVEMLGGGAAASFSYELNMIKSENGWVFNL